MKRTIQLLTVLLTLVLFTSLLAGCSKDKLSDAFDEETVKQQALADITLAESDDFAGWQSRFAPEYQSAVTKDAYTAYLNTLNDKGAFEEFGKIAIIGQKQNDTNYAVAAVICKHENGDIQYTVAYDENMNLVQFTI